MTPQETVYKLLKTIDGSINGFADQLSETQKQTYKKLLELIKTLDIDAGGNLKNNLNNIKIVGKLKTELEAIILDDKYVGKVTEFAKSFNDVQQLQNVYFSTIATEFTSKKLFDEVKKVAIESTIDSLTESGIGANYIDEIKQMLTTNITSGGSYADLTTELRTYVLGDSEKEGKLQRYGKQVATDSINQFNAQYTKMVSDDLGLSWYQYVGSLLTTSRPFCKEMVAKRYFHISEVPAMLNGKIGDKKVGVDKKTGLPYGMIEGTNSQTFFVNRGGYNCGHQIFPVAYTSVPKELRDKFD
jgi:hypothetical protein